MGKRKGRRETGHVDADEDLAACTIRADHCKTRCNTPPFLHQRYEYSSKRVLMKIDLDHGLVPCPNTHITLHYGADLPALFLVCSSQFTACDYQQLHTSFLSPSILILTRTV